VISSTTLAHLAAIRAEAMHKLVQYEQTMGCPCSHDPLVRVNILLINGLPIYNLKSFLLINAYYLSMLLYN